MYGYYLFLGRGDWGLSRAKSLDPTFGGNVATRLLGDWGVHRQGTDLADAPEWSSSWPLEVWQAHVDFLVDRLGADTLALCMNGFELPYASHAFPEAVERDHANVHHDMLQSIIDHAHQRSLRVIGVFCTTGHAAGYAAWHPDSTTIAADGTRSNVNLCHNNPAGRHYARTVTTEVLTRYKGFDGFAFHPPENTVPCRCRYCQAAFAAETGHQMATADDARVATFFWASCLEFQREMEHLGLLHASGARLYCITIPGRFEREFATVAHSIPKTTQLLHWDYASFGQRIPELLASLRLFGSRGHRVGFVPSSGWALDERGAGYGRDVVDQIAAVRTAGVTDLLYFVGAIWHETSLLNTSWKLHTGASPQ